MLTKTLVVLVVLGTHYFKMNMQVVFSDQKKKIDLTTKDHNAFGVFCLLHNVCGFCLVC